MASKICLKISNEQRFETPVESAIQITSNSYYYKFKNLSFCKIELVLSLKTTILLLWESFQNEVGVFVDSD